MSPGGRLNCPPRCRSVPDLKRNHPLCGSSGACRLAWSLVITSGDSNGSICSFSNRGSLTGRSSYHMMGRRGRPDGAGGRAAIRGRPGSPLGGGFFRGTMRRPRRRPRRWPIRPDGGDSSVGDVGGADVFAARPTDSASAEGPGPQRDLERPCRLEGQFPRAGRFVKVDGVVADPTLSSKWAARGPGRGDLLLEDRFDRSHPRVRGYRGTSTGRRRSPSHPAAA